MSYYAIIRYNPYTGKKEYLGYQCIGDGYWRNYHFMTKAAYMLNMANHNMQANPTYFRHKADAKGFALVLSRNYPHIKNQKGIRVEQIPDDWVPSCGWECSTCNKKHKLHCHNLKYDRQNICKFVMAVLPHDYVINKKRLDAPCDVCQSSSCAFYQGGSLYE